MRIKWLHHPTKPELNGTTEHVSRECAHVAVGFQQAEYAPYKNYVERLSEESKLRTGPSPYDTPIVFFKDPVWKVEQRFRALVIFLHIGYEQHRFESAEQAKAAGAPASVLKQYAELKALPGPDAVQAALERMRREQTEREQKENVQKYSVLR
jgi:hypothetical protein